MMAIAERLFIFMIILLAYPLAWAEDTIEPSYDHQLNRQENGDADGGRLKQSEDGSNYVIEEKKAFLPMRGRKEQLYDLANAYSGLGSGLVHEDRATLIGLPDETIDLPGKRKFIPLRGRKGQSTVFYRLPSGWYPSLDGYRKKAAFTGMRGKKMSDSIGLAQDSSYANSLRQIIEPFEGLTWNDSGNLKENDKRARPFAAMRGRRSLRRGRAIFYATRG